MCRRLLPILALLCACFVLGRTAAPDEDALNAAIERACREAEKRYLVGDGRDALEVIQNAGFGRVIELHARVSRVVEEVTSAQRAMAAKDAASAKAHWSKVLELELDSANEYRRVARKSLEMSDEAISGGPLNATGALRKAQDQFRKGDGKGALTTLAGLGDAGAVEMRDLLEQVVAATIRAQKAEAASQEAEAAAQRAEAAARKDETAAQRAKAALHKAEAVESWKDVVRFVADPTNQYSLVAQGRLRELGSK